MSGNSQLHVPNRLYPLPHIRRPHVRSEHFRVEKTVQAHTKIYSVCSPIPEVKFSVTYGTVHECNTSAALTIIRMGEFI
jgi:hypothetical protein